MGRTTRWYAVLTVGAVMAVSATAFAGSQVQWHVAVEYHHTATDPPWYSGGAARGGVLLAQTSPDEHEYIYCSVTQRSSAGESWRYGSCVAQDPDGRIGSCFTREERMLNAMLSVNGHSSVRFTWDRDGACRSIRVEQTSSIGPWPGYRL